MRTDGGHDVLDSTNSRNGRLKGGKRNEPKRVKGHLGRKEPYVLEQWQVVLEGKLAADLPPLAEESAFGEEEDPSALTGHVHFGEMGREIHQGLLPPVFPL